MSDLEAALADNRAHAERFIAALAETRMHWAVPVRPGKWSPAEVAEHVTLGYHEAGRLARGERTGFPRLPRLLQPVARFYYRRVLRTGMFPRARTFKNLTPQAGAPDPEQAATRIRAALEECEASFRALTGPLRHPAFGEVPSGDYVRFLGYHTRHHQRQLKP